jgi:predicted SPOUT superfamily RNA methylase MTH1
MAVEGRIADKWSGSDRVLVGFGAPSRGLHEIVEDEHLKLNDLADFVVNTVPNQGTVTVRTEEALLATLAILNLNLIY